MPSPEHEAPLELFRARPALARTLMREGLGLELPAHARVRVASSEWTELPQYRPDLAVVFEDDDGSVRMAVAVELQRAVDSQKAYRWPLYAAALRARHRSTSALLVVAPDEDVARWAEAPIVGLQPGSPFVPLVIGPSRIPTIASAETARAAPELAVLSAMAHSREFPATLDPVVAALVAADGLPPEIAELYFHLTVAVLSPAARETLRMIMATHTPFMSEFGRELIEEGRQNDLTQGKREALLAILRARGLAATDEQRARVLACSDDALLDRWIARAAIAQDAGGIFE